jgi:WW domain-binding protein 4
VGGYQLHSVQGAVGGAKGVGMMSGGGKATAGGGDKRKRDGDGAKELSKEDRDFLARREAARQRVQQRTAASFGLT